MSSRGCCWRSVDHRRHVRAEARDRVGLLGADAERLVAHQQVAPDAELVLVLVRHTEQRADEHRRDLRGEVLDEVEPGPVPLRVEELRAQLARRDPRARRRGGA